MTVIRSLALAALATVCAVAAVPLSEGTQPTAPRVPVGKRLTDRSITQSALVAGALASVYARFTTAEGVRRFFGVDAAIDMRPGGAYEVFFKRREEADAVQNSSTGCRVLWYVDNQEVAFEWNAPPYFASELNLQPLPMWVVVTLSPEPGRQHTLVQVQHHGFGRSALWDRVFEFYVRAWPEILLRLQRDAVAHPGWRPRA